MSLPKAKLREIVINVLFSQSFSSTNSNELAQLLMTQFKTTKKNLFLVFDVVKAIVVEEPKIDELIKKFTQNYGFHRITVLEKAVLRLGFYELFIEKKEPPKVCINEAIRVTKKFGSLESSKFVNAVLDEAYKNECNH